MKIPPMIEDVVSDLIDSEHGYDWWSPDTVDVDLYLSQLQSNTYQIQQERIMESLRDGLDDKFGTVFALAAACKDPTMPAALDALSIVSGLVRAQATVLLLENVEQHYEDCEGQQNQDPWNDQGWEDQQQERLDGVAT